MVMAAGAKPRAVEGLAALVGEFDGFVVDQYGVLHDGTRPYPGAVAALARLAALAKPVVLLTNSSKRAARNAARMAALGFDPATIHGIVSSGEIAWQGIRSGSLGPPFNAGRRVFLIGHAGDDDYELGPLDVTVVVDPAAADFLLIAGSDVPAVSLADYERLLQPAAAAGIPALCINPDKLRFTPSGLLPAPGVIAECYEGLGGPVTYIGKPHPAIYHHAVAALPPATRNRILAIGDSAEHDVRGGAAAGLATALVLTGVQAGGAANAALPQPDFILPAFRWE
jgi:HAD superfamily hydrolase (TIGR01459 family)